MPWCESCAKYFAPTAMNDRRHVPDVRPAPSRRDRAAGAEEVVADEGTPWHFKLLIGVVAIYLGFRTVQMISWLI